MYRAKVWLNGELLGEHIGGYLPFTFDVTGEFKSSANRLVVRVDNRIDWLPAAKQIEWVQYGGILQAVRVETKSQVFLSNLAIQAVPDGQGARVACVAEISAETGASTDRLLLRIGVAGDEESARTAQVAICAGTTARQEVSWTLNRAAAWSPETPVLHTLAATLERDGTVIERLASPFGARTIAARGPQLLFNGRPPRVRGVNRYDEYGRFGPNPSQALLEDELRLVKTTGINLIRAHYPRAPEFLSLCDRLGILFLDELPLNWWGVDWFGKEGVVQDERILDRALPMLETMIRRDFNHPSVIMWSMANESKTDSDVGIKVMRALIHRAKELDRSRLVTFVTAPGSVRAHRAFEDADLVAFNVYYGSLSAPLAEHRDQLDERVRRPAEAQLHRRLTELPGKPMLVTEFGAMGLHGLRGEVPSTEDFQAEYLRAVWAAISSVPEISGGVVWSWADYNHRHHFQSLGPFGAFGAVTIDRKPKAALKALAAMYGNDI
jgi:beta-glucuronidase